ncbi:hypothetical protein HYW87_00190 [Candidatus Roizmanbacteria bacterium]|nr:hypothetical protein [Candidatus Roizmanbacteria bacterium]
MLDGKTENASPVKTSPKVIPIEILNTPNKPSSTPLPRELLKEHVEEVMKLKTDPARGGATEAGAKKAEIPLSEEAVVFHNFLKKKIDLKSDQFDKLPQDLQDQITNFNPQDEKELNEKGMALYERVKQAGVLTEDQVKILDDLQKAVVVDGVLKPTDIFSALKEQVKDLKIPEAEKQEANDQLKELQEDLENKDIVPAQKAKSFVDRMPKLVKWVGLGGIAALLFSLWRAFKDVAGGSQPMAA